MLFSLKLPLQSVASRPIGQKARPLADQVGPKRVRSGQVSFEHCWLIVRTIVALASLQKDYYYNLLFNNFP